MAQDVADRATSLLNRLGQGDAAAADELLPLIQTELHRLADVHMARERADHTLRPTDLVHDCLVGLKLEGTEWPSRSHFFSMASKAMRNLLVTHARRKKAEKHGGKLARVALDDCRLSDDAPPQADVLAVHEALETLAQVNAEWARLVELRFFGGLSMDEIAEVMQSPKRTVERRWKAASLWLREKLSDDA